MDEKEQTKDNRNMHAIVLAVLGIFLVIIGEAIRRIPGAPLRGSGAGAALLILGIILLVIAVLRFLYKRK